MAQENKKLQYQKAERIYNKIIVTEYKPIYDAKTQKERSQYVTQRCIELLQKYNRI